MKIMMTIKRGIVLAFMAAPALLSAAVFTNNPVADAFVTTGPTGNLSDNNYGSSGGLSVAAPGGTKLLMLHFFVKFP